MYPNSNQPTPPLDYLNQIAPKSPPKVNNLFKKPIILGAALGFAILLTIISTIASSQPKSTELLAARLTTIASTADSATTNIKSTQLRAFNSNLKLYLTNAVRDITPILAKDGIDITKLDKKVTTAESNADLLATLEDARLNAVYDRTYAREMAYKLDTVITLMRQINSSTGNKDLKSYLNDAIANLTPIQKQFADFNAANS
ncbi:MAG: hypothetical protein WCJ36_01175 [Candidatus Saccharibacteria bacterium]